MCNVPAAAQSTSQWKVKSLTLKAGPMLVPCFMSSVVRLVQHWALLYKICSSKSSCTHQLWRLRDDTHVCIWSTVCQMCLMPVCNHDYGISSFSPILPDPCMGMYSIGCFCMPGVFFRREPSSWQVVCMDVLFSSLVLSRFNWCSFGL